MSQDLMDLLQGMTDVCLSGGAEGADIEWGSCAEHIGHKVIHWSFPGHHSMALESQLVRLSDEQLKLGDEALQSAAIALRKSPPRRPNVLRLLQRNFYQIAWSQACYAVTVIGDDGPAGGTGWAITMFIQSHPESHEVYVFDQEKDVWFQYAGGTWKQITCPPRPTGIWAGIGSRELKENGKKAIRGLMDSSSD